MTVKARGKPGDTVGGLKAIEKRCKQPGTGEARTKTGRKPELS